MATANWRTINIDRLDPDSSANFDNSSLLPSIPFVSTQEVQNLSSQIKQLLRGGDAEGALRGALENAPYGGDAGAKVNPFFAFLLFSLRRSTLQSLPQAIRSWQAFQQTSAHKNEQPYRTPRLKCKTRTSISQPWSKSSNPSNNPTCPPC